MKVGNRDQYSDEQAKAILAPAIELDAHAPSTSADELRAIAADVGISPTALEAAIREQRTALVTRRAVTTRRAITVVMGVGLPLGVTVGAALGNLTPSLGAGWFVAMGAMGIGLLASALFESSWGRARPWWLTRPIWREPKPQEA